MSSILEKRNQPKPKVVRFRLTLSLLDKNTAPLLYHLAFSKSIIVRHHQLEIAKNPNL